MTYSIIKAKSLLIDRGSTSAVKNEAKSLIPLNVSFIHFYKILFLKIAILAGHIKKESKKAIL